MKYFFWVLCISVATLACNSASTSETAQTSPKEPAKATPTKTATTKPVQESMVKWLTLEEAQKMNAKKPKKILVDVYTAWCGPCKMMDRTTFNNPDVAKVVNEDFYPVKFNAESSEPVKFNGQEYSNPNYRADIPKNRRNAPHQLVGKFGVRGYPTLVILDEKMNVKSNLVGFKQPNQLLDELAKL